MDATKLQAGAGVRPRGGRGGRAWVCALGIAALAGVVFLLAFVVPVGTGGVEGAGGMYYAYTIGTAGESGSDDAHFYYPEGVAVNSSGALYVTDTNNQRVQVFGAAGDYLYTLGTTGQPGSDDAHFDHPWGVAVNSSGALYVADTWNHRVQVFGSAGDYLYTLGTAGESGSDDAHFYQPGGVAVNSSGALYVADTYNHRVQVFGAAGDYLYTVGTTGQSGSDDAHFYNPVGVAVNSSGALYVTDTYNHRVQVFGAAGDYLYTVGTTTPTNTTSSTSNVLDLRWLATTTIVALVTIGAALTVRSIKKEGLFHQRELVLGEPSKFLKWKNPGRVTVLVLAVASIVAARVLSVYYPVSSPSDYFAGSEPAFLVSEFFLYFLVLMMALLDSFLYDLVSRRKMIFGLKAVAGVLFSVIIFIYVVNYDAIRMDPYIALWDSYTIPTLDFLLLTFYLVLGISQVLSSVTYAAIGMDPGIRKSNVVLLSSSLVAIFSFIMIIGFITAEGSAPGFAEIRLVILLVILLIVSSFALVREVMKRRNGEVTSSVQGGMAPSRVNSVESLLAWVSEAPASEILEKVPAILERLGARGRAVNRDDLEAVAVARGTYPAGKRDEWFREMVSSVMAGNSLHDLTRGLLERVPNLEAVLQKYAFVQFRKVEGELGNLSLRELDDALAGVLQSEWDNLTTMLALMKHPLLEGEQPVLWHLLLEVSRPLWDEARDVVTTIQEERRQRRQYLEEKERIEQLKQLSRHLLEEDVVSPEEVEAVEELKPVSDLIDDLFEAFKEWGEGTKVDFPGKVEWGNREGDGRGSGSTP
ncbi:MAG: hypothetical protein ACTSU5_10230 [Promethearchaeota archaeon]